jgi:NAD(P)-dependent dehydrogenase (short-subunit alcohol dehydrogenase family)
MELLISLLLLQAIENMDDEAWDFVIGVNQKGVLNCMRAEITNMNDNGSMVNASSLAGLQGFSHMSSYVASKHAVIGMAKSAAKEVGHRGIRVNVFCP